MDLKCECAGAKIGGGVGRVIGSVIGTVLLWPFIMLSLLLTLIGIICCLAGSYKWGIGLIAIAGIIGGSAGFVIYEV